MTSASGADAELENFLSRVDDISKIVSGLASANVKEQERAIRQADILLHNGSGDKNFCEADESKVSQEKTIINTIPDNNEMSQDAFMKMVEKDASERAADRKDRKKKSDEFRSKGNEAFRRKNYALALDNYNKAIQLIKDSPCLYTNRALTYIRVGVPSKAIEDLDQVIEINPRSLKAKLLKARALFNMCEPKLCRNWLNSIKEAFPENIPMIQRYEDDLFELRMELNECYDRDDPRNQSKPTIDDNDLSEKYKHRLHQLADGESLWIQASRGMIPSTSETKTEQCPKSQDAHSECNF